MALSAAFSGGDSQDVELFEKVLDRDGTTVVEATSAGLRVDYVSTAIYATTGDYSVESGVAYINIIDLLKRIRALEAEVARLREQINA